MSNNEVLYVKGMNVSESDGDDDEQDIWDDRKLNDAYDKALRIANAEVAKRIAMSTNTQRKNSGQPDDKKEKIFAKPSLSKGKKKESNTKWKSGMHCRAVYEEDGCEYEAFILTILNEKECVVRFLGYENSEIVPISTLKPTLGKNERTKQIEEALQDKVENPYASTSEPDQMELGTSRDEGTSNPDLTQEERSFSRKQKAKKKKNNQNKYINGFELPELPLPVPNLTMLSNHGSNDMPLPPPPPLGFQSSNRSDSEDQAISSMLLSWYMSGYYTGLYQGLKRARDGRRNP
ncbi:survival motor neuron protein [Galleria mellonella]|uniref:Survival motor neuron protein n=1 Tax=Galleria mellonella TaxID=7137 RepID=A0A6J1WMX5_GALME|nr:survival motor neuron protein [Galleria mellonella]